MKVAVSIPDPVFKNADDLASRLNTTRSALYSRALEDYLLRHNDEAIIASINAVVDEVGDGNDKFLDRVARETLARTEW